MSRLSFHVISVTLWKGLGWGGDLSVARHIVVGSLC